MHEAASRVLRNVIGAVIGDSASGGTNCNHTDENCSCPSKAASPAAAAVPPAGPIPTVGIVDANDPLEDEASDYDSDSQLLSRQRRTAPRACVPSNTSSDLDVATETERREPQTLSKIKTESQTPIKLQEQAQTQLQPQAQNQMQSTSSPQTQPKSQPQQRYRCFEDDFASDLFFEDFEE